MILSNVAFEYERERVFSGISYTFDHGIYALTGKSGCGKTTLLRLMAGLLSPSEGTVTGGGSGAVSMAFQDFRLFPALTALENAALFGNEERAKELLLSLRFLPEDLQKRPSKLSGGMQQRVSLVRAMLADTPVLLLDEPTNALDDSVKAVLYPLLSEIAKTRTVIFATHDREDIRALNATEVPFSALTK